ncbi:MAG: type II secretion system protein N [Rhodoferax sp.]
MARAAHHPLPAHLATARAPWAWAWAGAGLGLLAASTLFAPAPWLASLVFAASHGQVQLHEARGSLWTGSGQLALTGGRGSADAVALPGPVSWTLRPAWGGLNLHLQADCCTPVPLALQIRWLRWTGVQLSLADGQSSWPANLLAGLGTPWNTVQARGQLAATSEGLQLQWAQGRMELQGQLRLDALNVSSRLSTLVPMGSYRLSLAGGATPTLSLQTLSGSLQLQGQGQWVGQRLRFSGVASAEPDRVEALSNLLNIVGRRDGARSLITLGS